MIFGDMSSLVEFFGNKSDLPGSPQQAPGTQRGHSGVLSIRWSLRDVYGGEKMLGNDTGVIKLDTFFWGIKLCKCMVVLRDSSYNNALFGLVI